MKKSKIILFLIGACFLSFVLFAENKPLNFLLDEEIIKELEKNESIISISYKNSESSIDFSPKSKLIAETKQKWKQSHESPALIEIEGLFLYKKSKTERDLFESYSESQDIEKMISIFTSISNMKGMEYYSERKKKYQVLYEDFYVIDTYEEKNPIPDPKVDSLEKLHILAFQKDTTFGSYIMDLEYFQNGSEFAMYMKNLDPLKYLLFKAIQQDNLHLYLYTYDLEDEILLYIFVQADYLNISILNQTIEKSLVNRIDAIYNWFKIQYGGKKWKK